MKRIIGAVAVVAGVVLLTGCSAAGDATPAVTVTVTASASPSTVYVPVPAEASDDGLNDWEIQQQMDDAAAEAAANAEECRRLAKLTGDSVYSSMADGWGMDETDLENARQHADVVADGQYQNCMASQG